MVARRARAGVVRRVRRHRAIHIASPPSAITHVHDAASSLYIRPGSPRFRLRCNPEIQVRSGRDALLP